MNKLNSNILYIIVTFYILLIINNSYGNTFIDNINELSIQFPENWKHKIIEDKLLLNSPDNTIAILYRPSKIKVMCNSMFEIKQTINSDLVEIGKIENDFQIKPACWDKTEFTEFNEMKCYLLIRKTSYGKYFVMVQAIESKNKGVSFLYLFGKGEFNIEHFKTAIMKIVASIKYIGHQQLKKQ